MKKTYATLEDGDLECYLPDAQLSADSPLALIALGIPRNGPNNKSYCPGQLFADLQNGLASAGVDSCIVGVPGMGGSAGNTLASSLEKRAGHIAAILETARERPLWLIGYSMGAAVLLLALKQQKIQEHQIAGLSLIAPASYPIGSENKCFGLPFKNALQQSKANMLEYPKYLAAISRQIACHLLIAEFDKTIPDAIIRAYQSSLAFRARQGCSCLTSTIPKASHNLIDGDWASDELAEQILAGIRELQFISAVQPHKPAG